MTGRAPLRSLWLTTLLGTAADQLTKLWAADTLSRRGPVVVARCCVELRLVYNRGAFFSLGAQLPGGVRRAFFITVSLAAIGLLARFFRNTQPEQRRLRWALSFLSAGAAGNLIDRVLADRVTDFMHLHAGELFHWATFNVADIWIALGLSLLLWDIARPARAP